ncbi:hypothetical protein [Reyranella sp.]|uniref:hypothetical protein n=1 Tax=Reyranella sp. TaxID=1929291 RepID=UPI003D112918
MSRSIAVAILSAAALTACAQKPAEPPPVAAAPPEAMSFISYCGPVWSVGRQGYLQIPCPPDVNYLGAQ